MEDGSLCHLDTFMTLELQQRNVIRIESLVTVIFTWVSIFISHYCPYYCEGFNWVSDQYFQSETHEWGMLDRRFCFSGSFGGCWCGSISNDVSLVFGLLFLHFLWFFFLQILVPCNAYYGVKWWHLHSNLFEWEDQFLIFWIQLKQLSSGRYTFCGVLLTCVGDHCLALVFV